ncbi:type III secretion system export apparatus subunit SctS [Paraburkholderia rhynchosiae]|uniref:EscS/YscS/HrcS family type III secretion system export apparatus protein n=1 Tax=Paraburkholderia rhynchosiae TaxID=487049 RepID=A0A2N7W606_9BURK|nr:type III secretion system export apparatus subunit SctS [Paraburkholderia rhynchosiae]PMS24819.1 EscS/YscS/HrcS family type III secretion system export apparatus protein [Paraburkholderia rhynchosiae]CAB3725533.1 Surface presentation of antigens protein SpaQ [Paraburkholderia rhynchosiae]
MEYDAITHLTTQALTLCLMVSLPPVAVAAVTGLLIAFVQAVTSLQDSSISQSVKLVVVTIVIVIAAPWGAAAIQNFARTLMQVMFP